MKKSPVTIFLSSMLCNTWKNHSPFSGSSLNYLALCSLWVFPGSSASKESICNAGGPGWLSPGSGRSPGAGRGYPLQYPWASLVIQLVKNPPAMRETWVPSLGWEDPLEEGNPLQYSCPENPHGQRHLAGCGPQGHKESDTTKWLSTAQSSLWAGMSIQM